MCKLEKKGGTGYFRSVANFKIRKKKYVRITRNNKSCACLRSLTQLTTRNDNLSFRQPINLKSKTKKSTATSIVRSKSLTSTSSYSSRKLFFLARVYRVRANKDLVPLYFLLRAVKLHPLQRVAGRLITRRSILSADLTWFISRCMCVCVTI